MSLLVNTLALGAAYALVALGFVLVLNAAGAVNFAHGDLVMTGGMVAAVSAVLVPGITGLVLLPVVVVILAGLGAVVAVVVWLPLRRRPAEAMFIATIALGVILQNGALLLAGPEPRVAPALVGEGTVVLGGVVVSRQALAIIGVAGGLIAALYLLLTHTQLGRRLRAVAQDAEMARACGIPVTRLILTAFALGAALAGAGGVLLAHQFFVIPGEGGALILKAYIAVTVGGWGSLAGAVVGALVVAGFETAVATWISQPAALAGLYGAVLVVLLIRPQGLFGEDAGRRV